jgi:DNA-binding beta-propeller fold protein YncE
MSFSYSLTLGKVRQFPAFRLLALFAVITLFDAAPSVAADMQYPLAVVATDDGTVFVADRKLPGIWKVTGDKTEVYFQGSKKFRTPLNAVRCVAIDKDGLLLAGDSSTREVYRFDKAGKPQPLTKGGIGIPMSIAVDADGDLFVADLETQRIWKVPAAGGEPQEFAVIPAPRGLAFDKQGRLWVVSHGKNQLIRFSADGKSEVVVKGRPFRFPHQVVLDDAGTAYVSDGYSKAIWKIADGKPPEKWVEGKPLDNPVGIALRGKDILIADPRANALFVIDAEGKLSTLIQSKPAK